MNFLDDRYMLNNEVAEKLFFEHAKDMPIYDFHNHLNPKEIYEDRNFDDISKIWLNEGNYGDHYKWRLMRACGVQEEKITGNASGFEKFKAYSETLPKVIGNPVYTFSHMELKRYFGIDEPLTPDNCEKVYERCNELLKTKEFSVRNLLRKMNVKTLCTTDDPIDDLKWHKLIKEDGFEIRVLPSYRPDKAFNIDKEGYKEYLKQLSDVSGVEITDVATLVKALEKRLDYFVEMGCAGSDHAVDGNIYEEADEATVTAIMKKALNGETLTTKEIRQYKGYLYVQMGERYYKRNVVMQLHIGAMRNNSTRSFRLLGADTGYDSIGSGDYLGQLQKVLDQLDLNECLPKTILYSLSANDNDALITLMQCFQKPGQPGHMQYGSAWWFNDHKTGIEKQLNDLADNGVLSTFVGMLTDSRSFLSFSRHEYFRRILCNKLGTYVENGDYPYDLETLGKIVEDISYNNALHYFG